jgi:uncharacterized DUF497 family protein
MVCRSKLPCWCSTIRSTHQGRTATRTVTAGTRSDFVGPVLLLVIHTWPEAASAKAEPVGRIISARKATAHERKVYEEGNF